MMIKNTLLAALLTSSVLAVMPMTSFAKGDCNSDHNGQQMSHVKGEHGGHKNGLNRMDRMAEKLGFSEEQKTEIQLIMDRSREAKDSIREQMIENRQSLRALDTTSADYDANVKAIASTIAKLEEDKIVSRSNIRKDIEAVLTYEQKEQMAEMKDNKGKRH